MNATARKKIEPEVPEHLRELAKELPLTLDLKQTAEVLKMHKRSVQRMIAAGEIRATRARMSRGARVIITRSEIIRWFARREA